MKASAGRRWLTMLAAAFVVWVSTLIIPATVQKAESDWLDALTNAVLIERRSGGGHPGVRFEPYLGQLQVVRTQFERGDVHATYKAMNRFMDMLEKRENGIPAATADWLFDFCYIVTPAKYHDVSRHMERFRAHQFGNFSSNAAE